MSPAIQGSIVLVVTLLMLVSGIPVAFGLGAIAIAFLVIFQGFDGLNVVAETFWSGLDEFTLVAIPMFVMMGAAIGSSPAGKDLYEALDRWLYRFPGGLVDFQYRRLRDICGVDRVLAGLLRRHRQDGHSGNAPPRLSGRGRDRLDLRRRHARHSDSAVDHLHPLWHRHRDFDRPAVHRRRDAGADADRPVHAVDDVRDLAQRLPLARRRLSLRWKEKFQSIPKIAPFLIIVRRHVLALWRRRDAVGSGRRRRRDVPDPGDRDLPAVEAGTDLAHPARHHAGVGDDPDHHRHRRAVRLHADLALSDPDAGAGDRRPACQQMGVDVPHQHLPAGLRLFHSARRHHPDDQPDPAADHHRSRVRSRSGSA